MTYYLEHWTPSAKAYPEDGGSDLFANSANIETYKNDPTQQWQLAGLRYCCTIEAESYNDAMCQYHDHMCWEPYQPMED